MVRRLFRSAGMAPPTPWPLQSAAAAEQVTDEASIPCPTVPAFECEDDLEERLAIMVVGGGVSDSEARAALGLPVVDKVTGGRCPGPEDWSLVTNVWIERSQSLHCNG